MWLIFIIFLLWSTWLIFSTWDLVSYFCLGWNCYNASIVKGFPQYPEISFTHISLAEFVFPWKNSKWKVHNSKSKSNLTCQYLSFQPTKKKKVKSKLNLTWKEKPAWNTVQLSQNILVMIIGIQRKNLYCLPLSLFPSCWLKE